MSLGFVTIVSTFKRLSLTLVCWVSVYGVILSRVSEFHRMILNRIIIIRKTYTVNSSDSTCFTSIDLTLVLLLSSPVQCIWKFWGKRVDTFLLQFHFLNTSEKINTVEHLKTNVYILVCSWQLKKGTKIFLRLPQGRQSEVPS